MSEEFVPLGNQEIIEVNTEPVCNELPLKSSFKLLLLKAPQFIAGIKNKLGISDDLKNQLFEDGIDCGVLKLGAKNWQVGKIRARIIMEFCPYEQEESETNQVIKNDLDSLDDLRKELNQ